MFKLIIYFQFEYQEIELLSLKHIFLEQMFFQESRAQYLDEISVVSWLTAKITERMFYCFLNSILLFESDEKKMT